MECIVNNNKVINLSDKSNDIQTCKPLYLCYFIVVTVGLGVRFMVMGCVSDEASYVDIKFIHTNGHSLMIN